MGGGPGRAPRVRPQTPQTADPGLENQKSVIFLKKTARSTPGSHTRLAENRMPPPENVPCQKKGQEPKFWKMFGHIIDILIAKWA